VPRKYTQHPKEVRQSAIRAAIEVGIPDAAAQHAVDIDTLRYWLKQHGVDPKDLTTKHGRRRRQRTDVEERFKRLTVFDQWTGCLPTQ
jgi:transposase-like protein